MYCSECHSFIDGLSVAIGRNASASDTVPWVDYSARLHESLAELEKASLEGCLICRNVWHSWSDNERARIPKDSSVHLEVVVDQGKPILKASMRSPNEPFQPRMLAIFVREITSGGS